ncbi:MAG: carboxylating nicotinate-nucleotide diphosphorylase [Bacteroidia bacterium]|nr:carboxylating nicotinate-nucleotide diphosphorylase [Bacteroidia bacterium]
MNSAIKLPQAIDYFISYAISEDVGSGDHSSIACIAPDKKGKAKLLIKQKGIISGISVACSIFRKIDRNIFVEVFMQDGNSVKTGDIAFEVDGLAQSILKSERLVLNVMQRMSGIATTTRQYVEKLDGLKTKVLDTRKTTPGFRFFEKLAVRTGGGENHRMGLYDMIMLKDNHIDYAGGIEAAIRATNKYLRNNPELAHLRIEIEARNLADVGLILKTGGIHRIMLDNFDLDMTATAVRMIDGIYETESSGMINLENIRDYALCGVDYISVGALTHQVKSLDMSLKAVN